MHLQSHFPSILLIQHSIVKTIISIVETIIAMADHQPYAIGDWNFPRSPVSQHPEAALNEVHHQENPVMDMMLSQINDGDSVWKQNNAFRYLDHGSEEQATAGLQTPTNDVFDWLGGGDAGASSTHTSEWEKFVQEDHTNDVFGGQHVFLPRLEVEDHVQDEQPEEPMDIGAPGMAVEKAVEDPAPVAGPVAAPVEEQEDNEPMDEQEMEIDHDAMEREAEPIEENVQGPPAPIQEALSPEMVAALEAPLVDAPGSNDIDFPVEMMEAEATPEPSPASSTLPAPASSTLPAPASSTLPAPASSTLPAPAPATLPVSAPASPSLPAPTPTPAVQAPSPDETPAPVPVQIPSPTDGFEYEPAEENRPALIYVERIIESVVIKSGVPCRPDKNDTSDSDDDFDPLAPAPAPHTRRIFWGRRCRARSFKKRSKKVPDVLAPPASAPTPLAVVPTPPAHVAPVAPTIAPAPALIAAAPPAISPTLATISLASQLAWQPWVPAGNKDTAKTLIPRVTQKKIANPRRAPRRRRQTQAEIREELLGKAEEEQRKKDQQRRERELRAQKLAVKRMEMEEQAKKEVQRLERDERAKRLPAKRKAAQDLLDAKRKAAQDLRDAKRRKKN
ncbi:hypothetical protein CAEBREN_25631 [Caenorhabditis brenneri]|uniref:Uncharacterized protein n=1 Tax=Caenorhabditis brenneri TaxID=135651 RepID=G0NL17_CAEBE|nr:hypothetical protein CAEBREN_25631 [Caenorhabditis brenneri]